MKVVDPKLWQAADGKARQLETAISACSATLAERAHMTRLLHDLWMYANDALPTEPRLRELQRRVDLGSDIINAMAQHIEEPHSARS